MARALRKLALAALVASPSLPCVAAVSGGSAVQANPIRKVVSLLQAMQKKVEQEGEKETELYDRFQCYCKNGARDLSASIGSGETKTPELESSIKASEEQKTQLEADVKKAQQDRVAAKKAVEEATAVREKESAAFAAYKADADANIAAIGKAVAALEKGSSAFLQTSAAQALKALVGKQEMQDADRDEVMAFLEGRTTSGYAPQAGEVTGILKQLGDEMSQALASATASEQSSVEAFHGLVTAKEREIAALTEAIETKIQRVGELGVAIVQLKNDLGETAAALLADKDFLANLETTCASKKAEWEERQKTRSEELAALADTIKLLNDDEALDLFKDTLPSPSFVQVVASAADVRQRALEAVRGARRAGGQSVAMLDRILVALHGKQGDFGNVVKLIDGMVELLKKEQVDDDSKKEYCSKQFDNMDDKKKGLERSVADTETAIAKTQEGIERLTQEIAELDAGIKALDKSVAEASAQRQQEHEEYQQLIASNNAAKQLLNLAKNRLNKFYNPRLYKEAPKQELSAQDRIATNMGAAAALVQVSAHVQKGAKGKVDPGPAPETFGAYGKKAEESNGVMAMIDLLIKDLDKEITEAEAEEKNAQKDYETLTKDATAKRTADSKALTEKEASKAELQGDLESQKTSKASATKELMATLEYIQSLHGECDWLLQNFEVRKEARAGEADSLKKAKAVLSGASFSLLETTARRASLRGSH